MPQDPLIRKPAVAGSFYSGNAAGLKSQIEQCFLHGLGPGQLPTVNPAGARSILGLVCPHAGFMYSGPVAAWAFFALASDGLPKTVVLIGPNHRGWGADLAVWTKGSWSTPLGKVAVDESLAHQIVDAHSLLEEDNTAHLNEHSLEVEIPFLQYLAHDHVKVVPIAMMHQGLAAVMSLGQVLGKVLAGQDVVLIASTDFSHYVSQTQAEKYDRMALNRIEAMDAEGLIKVVQDHQISMCGSGPVAAMLIACKALGATQAELLRYSTSGDVTGNHAQVVGYGAVKIER